MTRDSMFAVAAVALIVVASTASAIGVERRIESPAKAAAIAHPGLQSSPMRTVLAPSRVKEAMDAGALDREVKTLLKVAKPMRHGEFLWNDSDVPAGPVWIRVDLDAQLISIFRAGHEIGTAVILYGADEKATPEGQFKVKWKRKDHRSSTYDAPMPYTLRLTDDGISIHGSEILSGRATHGCIGVPTDFAKRLFEEMATGDEVVIVA
jgi:lipoprotein-anchoring transpeptidase ErfK/SrfK